MIWEFHAGAGANVADAGHRLVLSIAHSATNHNGGQLQFGPDGYLYIGVGDNANGANGQNPGVLLGKILRIDPRSSGAQPYTIPPGQPFAPGAAAEVYAYGFRNPWRFSFDSLTGDLLIGEVGENDWEEIDSLPAGQPAGANLGWNCWEGTHPYAGGHCSVPYVAPILEYAHDATHCSISGGFVARDPTVPTIAGRFLYADYCGTSINAVLLPVGSPPDIAELGTAPQIAGFGQDSDGHLYVTSLKGGVWRITGTGAADKPPIASFTLSTTTPAVGATLHLDASSSTDPDGPDLQLHVGHQRRRQDRRPRHHLRRELSDGRRATDHADGHGHGRSALVTHAARLRRRQDDAPGQHECRRQAPRDAVRAQPAEARGGAQERAPGPIPGERVGDVGARGHAAAGAPRTRDPAARRSRTTRQEDVQGSRRQRHRAAPRSAGAHGRDEGACRARAGPGACRGKIGAASRARARAPLTLSTSGRKWLGPAVPVRAQPLEASSQYPI